MSKEPLKSSFFIFLLISLVAASFLRLYDIDVRPLHHDEGVNYHFFQQVDRMGYYKYSHQNYHGPLFFYLHTATISFFGDSILFFRLPTIIAGILVCLTPLFLLPLITQRGALFIIPFIALSSSLIFHSRYAIHETMLTLCGILFGIYTYRYFRSPTVKDAALTAFFIALAFTLKETTIILLGALPSAIFFTFGWQSTLSGLKPLLKHAPISVFIGMITIIVIYSGGLQWTPGVREFFMAFPQWIDRGVGDTGHFKPFSYYLYLLWKTETPLLFGIILSILLFIPQVSHRVFITDHENEELKIAEFFGVWSLGLIFIHSCIPYKMPWIHIQWLTPLCFTLGLLLNNIRFRSLTLILTAGLVFYSVYLAHQWNFNIPYGKKNPLSYVHTSPGLVEVAGKVEKILLDNPKERILIDTSSYWPLPYYLRKVKKRTAYRKIKNLNADMKSYGVLLIDKKRKKTHLEKLPADCWRSKYYRLSDVSEGFLAVNTCRLEGEISP